MTEWRAKAPALQFYVRDWLTERDLRRLSYAARGLWIDVLCWMWLAPTQGVLEEKSRADLCRILGGNQAEISPLINEIISSGVADSNHPGHILNRRMVRQAKLKQTRSKSGKLGGSKTASKLAQIRDLENLDDSDDYETCLSKTPSKALPESDQNAQALHQAKRAAASASASAGTLEVPGFVPHSHPTRARGRQENAPPELADGDDIFEEGDPAIGTGRRLLKGHAFSWYHLHEIQTARAEYETHGLPPEAFTLGLRKTNTYLERRQFDHTLTGGLAATCLTGKTLEQILKNYRTSNSLTNGKGPKQFISREEKNSEVSKKWGATNGTHDTDPDRAVVDVTGECIAEDDAIR